MDSADSKNDQFWKACDKGELAAVQGMIKDRGVDLNWQPKGRLYHECTPLFRAVLHKHEEVVKELLCNGANPNLMSDSKFTPLMLAASAGDCKSVEHLLNGKADTDIQGNKQETALHRAAKYAHMEVIKMLLEAKASIDKKNDDGNTPLLLAAKEGHPYIVKYLLEEGANDTIQNRGGHTASQEAKMENQTVCLSMFRLEPDIPILWEACRSGDLDTVKKHWHKVELDWWNPHDDSTMLHAAAECGRKSIVLELLKRGARTDIASMNGNTPLIIAAKRGDKKIVEHLIEWNAKLDTANNHKDTALHIAAKLFHTDVVEQLVTAGTPLDAQNDDGNTPLHMACEEGHADIVKFLLHKGARPDVKNKKGKTPRHVAVEAGQNITFEEFPATDVAVQVDLTVSKEEVVDSTVSKEKVAVQVDLTSSTELNTADVIRAYEVSLAASKEKEAHRSPSALPRIDFAVQVDLTASKEEVAVQVDPTASKELNTADVLHAYEVSLAASKEKEQQLQSELDEARQMCHDKDQEVAKLEEELQTEQKKTTSLTNQCEQQHKELEILQQKADNKERDLAASKEKEQQLLAKLDMTKRLCQDKDQKISELEQSSKELNTADVLHAYEVSLAGSKEKEQQLRSEVDEARQMYHDKNQQISKLEEELQAEQKKTASLTDQYEQQQRELEMLQQKDFLEQQQKQLQQIADHKRRGLAASNQTIHQLLAELDTAKRMSRAKDQQISSVEEEMQIVQVQMTALITKRREQIELLQQKELSTTKRISRAKDWQISMLEEELQAQKMKMSSLIDQFREQRKKLDMLPQKTLKGHVTMDQLMETGLEKQELEQNKPLQVEKRDIGVQFNFLVPVSEHLRGVRIAGEKLFPVSGKGLQLLEWEEYGFRMQVPEGAISGPCDIAVKAIVAGQFDFPEGTELVSAVYAISASKRLNKLVTLEIQHSVAIKDEQQGQLLGFVRAECNQPILPYQFKLLENGMFLPGNQYGKLSCAHFSLFGTIKRLCQYYFPNLGDPAKKYIAQVYYEPKERRRNYWNVKFAVTQDLNALDKHVMEQHPEWEKGVRLPFQFHYESLELMLQTEALHMGWRIQPQMYPCKIYQKDVDGWNSAEPISCDVKLAQDSPSTTEHLHYPVKIRGIYPEDMTIYIQRHLCSSETTRVPVTDILPQDQRSVTPGTAIPPYGYVWPGPYQPAVAPGAAIPTYPGYMQSGPYQPTQPAVPPSAPSHPTWSAQTSIEGTGVPTSNPTTSTTPDTLLEPKDHANILQALATLVEWEELGLELGLLDTTLCTISRDQQKETIVCRREMLSAWLQWRDNVQQKGLPSWRRLLDALRRINHAALAAEIERSAPWRQ